MLVKKHALLGYLAAGTFMAGMFPSTTAVAQTTNECSAYSIRICAIWDELGYSSLKECRLQEYANCLAGNTRPREVTTLRIQPSIKPEGLI